MKNPIYIFARRIYHTQLHMRLEYERKRMIRIRKKLNVTYGDKSKIRVVFMQTYPSAWNTVKSIYQAMLENDKFEPYILAIPVQNEKTKKIENKAYNFFIENTDVPVINAYDNKEHTWFDLKSLSPDYVFYNRPYDSELINGDYKSCVVCQYSKICFTHYGYALSGDYQKFWKNNTFIYNTSFVFSENTSKFCEQSDALDKEIQAGLVKVYNIGYPRLDMYNRVPMSEKQTGKLKILWTPRWATERNNPDKSSFLHYYKDFLRFAEEHKEVSLVIRPHPKMLTHFLDSGIMSKKEIDGFRDYIINSENIDLDENCDYFESVINSDIIVSDYTALLVEFVVAEKKVIYCGRMDHFNEEGIILSNAFAKAQCWKDIEDAILGSDCEIFQKRDREILAQLGIVTDGTISNKIIDILSEDFSLQ